MHGVLSAYYKTVNLNGTVYMLQMLSVCLTSTLPDRLCLAVASCVDMGLGGANICYLTQINTQTERGGKWSSTGKKSFSFRNGLKRRLQNQF